MVPGEWKKPVARPGSADEAVRWWLGAHFVPISETEVGLPALDLYASYCDAAPKTGLPVLTGATFGRIAAALVPRGRTYLPEERGVKLRYQVRGKPDTPVPPDVRDGVQRGGALMRTLYLAACKEAGLKQTASWEDFRATRLLDEKLIARHIYDKHGHLPVSEPGRKALSIEKPVNEDNIVSIPVKALWADFPQVGWTYIRFLYALAQVTHVTRTETRKIAYLEKP